MQVKKNVDCLVKHALSMGGSIHPLIIPSHLTGGTGLMNPSILQVDGKLLVNLRHTNYTLYHSEQKVFHHYYGPLQYLHQENDMSLQTTNFLLELDRELNVVNHCKIDTSKHDKPPKWGFHGLEDARLVYWDNKLYATGVRRDVKSDGQGRMELSELQVDYDNWSVSEISRTRIPAPNPDNSYCEKNWMPIVDQPYTYVKWSNPVEIVKYNPETHITEIVYSGNNTINLPRDIRGGSQVIPYGDYYIALTHEVELFKSDLERKDGRYFHRFVVWDKCWNIVATSRDFNFMSGDVEFACGMMVYETDLLLTFAYQDNAAYILKLPQHIFNSMVGIKT